MVNYTLTRSKRKTLALYVRDGIVEVRAPLKMPKTDIDKFVASKENWITNRLAKSQEQAEHRDSFALDYGDAVTYRGKVHSIIAKDGGRVGFDDEHQHFYMPPNLTSEKIKAACVQIYRMLAERDLADKVTYFAKRMSVTPIAVKINSAKTRWGSCSSKKNLNFSWRLIMADDDARQTHELTNYEQAC